MTDGVPVVVVMEDAIEVIEVIEDIMDEAADDIVLPPVRGKTPE